MPLENFKLIYIVNILLKCIALQIYQVYIDV